MSTTNPRRSRRALYAAAAVAAVSLTVATVPSAMSAAQPSAPTHDSTVYDISVRATDGDGAALAERLGAAGFDLLELRQGSVVHVIGTAATARRLAAISGVTVVSRVPAAPQGPIPAAPASQDSILPKRLDGNKYPTYYGGYRTTAGYDRFESDLQAKYPELVKKVQYGKSFSGKHPLNAVCVTEDAKNGCKLTPNVDKARFLLETQIHAREVATSEMSWRYLTALVDGDGKDPQITALLKGSEIWVVPQVNPDGIAITENGITKHGFGEDSPAWQRKNDDELQTPPGGCPPPWAGSQPGVDMNRNWAVAYGGASTSKDPCSEVFIGKSKMSEPETQALASLLTNVFKDQRGSGDDPAPLTTTGEVLTMHTNGGVNIIPWDYSASVQTPNDTGIRSLGFRQSYFTGLPTGQSGQVLYSVGGGTDDWAYSKLGIDSGTWELRDTGGDCSGFFSAYTCMDAFAKIYIPGLVYTSGAARMPYKLSLGPTVLDAGTKLAKASVTVSAKADDDAFGAQGYGRPAAQSVKAARIFVGKAPWDGGSAQPMKLKGSGSSVSISATVKLGADRVLAYVQAQDARGNWGPAEAVWIPARA